MKIIKKRNNCFIGWKVVIDEEPIHIDPTDKKVTSTVYQRRNYLTIFTREFKVFDWQYIRNSKIKSNNEGVGFKK